MCWGNDMLLLRTLAASSCSGMMACKPLIIYGTTLGASEKADFNLGPSSDQCTKDGGRAVGHYTQMAWTSTRKIGCGVSQCSDGASLFVCQ